jgi:hypothetical protein
MSTGPSGRGGEVGRFPPVCSRGPAYEWCSQESPPGLLDCVTFVGGGGVVLPGIGRLKRGSAKPATTRDCLCLPECFLGAGLWLRGDCLSLPRGLSVPAPSREKSGIGREPCAMVRPGPQPRGVASATREGAFSFVGVRWGVGEDTATWAGAADRLTARPTLFPPSTGRARRPGRPPHLPPS